MRMLLSAVALLLFMLCGCTPAPTAVLTTHGRFKEIKVYHNEGNDDPLVMLVYDDQSETTLTDKLVAKMLDRHTDVITVSTSQIKKDFSVDVAKCYSISGDFDNLARYLEAYLHYQGFIPPIVMTTPGSQPLTALVLPKLSGKSYLGRFDLTQTKGKPVAADPAPCTPNPGSPAIEATPAIAINLDGNKVDSDELAAAFQQLYQRLPPEQKLDDAIADLPLTELPSANPGGDSLAIVISGDGGWAGFDKALAEALQAKDIDVVGWDSLRYFWQPRTPQSVAADLNKIIAYYMSHWSNKKLYLLGFSQGANVLPFILPLLEPAGRNALAKVELISPEHYAQFEFHLGNWVHSTEDGMALLPALRDLKDMNIICIFGSGDKATVCPDLVDTNIKVHGFKGGHHLTIDIPDMVDMLLE